MTKIIALVPTRGRPDNALRLYNAIRETTANVTTHYYVDDNDPELSEYKNKLINPEMLVTIGSPLQLSPATNWLANYWINKLDDSDILGSIGDDHLPQTTNWDNIIIDSLSGIQGVAYGNDLLQGEAKPTAAFVSVGLVRKLGYMCPPSLRHLFIDDFWKMLGYETNLRYLPQVIIEHLHPVNNKSIRDLTYNQGGLGLEVEIHDGAEWTRYINKDWPLERKKLNDHH